MTDLANFTGRELFDAMVDTILEMDEVSRDDRGETIDIKVAYCVFGTHYRQEFRKYDDRKVRANLLRKIREDNPDGHGDGFRGWLEFEYDGMTFMLQDDDAYSHTYQVALESCVECAEDDFAHAIRDTTYVSSYVTFDREAFIRDLEYGGDVEGWISPYDGTVHEVHTHAGWLKAWRVD